MKYFSIPADYNKRTIDRLNELNTKYSSSQIIETYGNITIGNIFGSGRSYCQLPNLDLYTLAEYVKYSQDRGIDFNYTFNSSFVQNQEFTVDGVRRIKEFMFQLHEIGIRSLTIALPQLIELVNSMQLGFKIKVSAIASIDNVNKAQAYKKMGVDKIVPCELINREIKTIKDIRSAFGEKVELIVNTPCYKDCSYRMAHYNQISCDSVKSTNDVSFTYFEHKCMLRRYSDVVNWMKINFIRPEDLRLYEQIGIQHFKLQGRQAILKDGDLVKTVEAYLKESFDGNMIDLINLFSKLNPFIVFLDNKKLDGFVEPFFKKQSFCSHDCGKCGYCEQFMLRNLDVGQIKEVCDLALEYYQNVKTFGEFVAGVDLPPKNEVNGICADTADFDF
ncbi:MAG: U32 family peptidase [Marinifilaceae bacterium]